MERTASSESRSGGCLEHRKLTLNSNSWRVWKTEKFGSNTHFGGNAVNQDLGFNVRGLYSLFGINEVRAA